MKGRLKILIVLSVSLGLLSACGAKKESAENLHFAKSSASTASASSGSSVSKESSLSTSSEITSNESLSSQATSSSQNVPAPSTTDSPYAVTLSPTQVPMTFSYHGTNVPKGVRINDDKIDSVTIFWQNGKITTYQTTLATIPTRQIRVFSAGINEIRTVKVNTEIDFDKNLTDNFSAEGPLYLFYNKQGGISLVTPNYAGNIPEDERDVMIEVLQ